MSGLANVALCHLLGKELGAGWLPGITIWGHLLFSIYT